MEYDFCARKLIDSGIAWGDGQVVKEYISKNSLFQDKMELRRTNYMQSYRDRIVTGGSEQFETDSYLKDTTYDYGKWAKVGDLLAKTIYRPFFSKERTGSAGEGRCDETRVRKTIGSSS